MRWAGDNLGRQGSSSLGRRGSPRQGSRTTTRACCRQVFGGKNRTRLRSLFQRIRARGSKQAHDKRNVNYRLTRHAARGRRHRDMLTWLAHKTTVAAAQPRAFSSSLACSMRKVKNCRCLPCLASYTRCSWKQTFVYCSRSTLVLNLMSCKKSASHLEI